MPIVVIFILLIPLHLSFDPARSLSPFDDLQFIEPMLKLSLRDYFSGWLLDRNNYAFPVRDLTFFADQFVSEKIGFNTFWFTQLFIFCIGLVGLNRILKLHLSQHLCTFALAIFAFHPLQSEILQWVSSRKVLLVFTFIIWAALPFFQAHKSQRPVTNLELGRAFCLWFLSLLCFPTAMLFPLWCLWMIRGQLGSWLVKILGTAGFGLLNLIYFKIVTYKERGYAVGPSRLTEDLFLSFDLGLQSLGRGLFNFLLPLQLFPYYKFNHYYNFLGLLFLAVVLGLVFRFVQKKTIGKEGIPLLLLGPVLFLPQALVFLTFEGFVWADRYTLVLLPTLVFLGLLPFLKWPNSLGFKSIAATVSLILLGLTAQQNKHWTNFLDFSKYCAVVEGASKCQANYINQLVKSSGGCDVALPVIQEAAKNFSQLDEKMDIQLKKDLPFTHGYCLFKTQKNIGDSDSDQFRNLFITYKGSAEVATGFALYQLRIGQQQLAWDNLKAVTIDPVERITSPPSYSFNTGILENLCAFLKKENCTELIIELRRKSPASFQITNNFDTGKKISAELLKQ